MTIKKGDIREKCPRWKGGVRQNTDNYTMIYMPEHPANQCGYVPRARLMLETYLGRYLKEGYETHHIDGDATNDSIDNLVEVTRSEHRRIHFHNFNEQRGRDNKGRFIPLCV